MSESDQPPFVIGVTGGIATGKSTVLTTLGELGAELIDADAVYHGLICPGLPLWKSLVRRFGNEIVAPDQTIDRGKLAAIAFSDPSSLASLDALTHPSVIAEVERRIACAASSVIAIDAVKLIESGLADACDRVWLVTCAPEVQRSRLISRNRLSTEEAERRLAAQPAVIDQAKHADLVIDNSGSMASTREHVISAWNALPVARRFETG